MLKATSNAHSPALQFGERPAQPSVPFAFDEVFSHDEGPQGEGDRDRLLKVLDALCEWLYPARTRRSTMALRAYVFVWYLRPEWLGNPTQVELAKRLRISKQSLGKVVSQMRRKFGFYVAGMRHEDARQKFAAHAKSQAKDLAQARRQAHHVKASKTVPNSAHSRQYPPIRNLLQQTIQNG